MFNGAAPGTFGATMALPFRESQTHLTLLVLSLIDQPHKTEEHLPVLSRDERGHKCAHVPAWSSFANVPQV